MRRFFCYNIKHKHIDKEMILQKYIAQSGFCSRRKAEDLIKDGKVLLNGEKAKPGAIYNEGDKVEALGKTIGQKKPENKYIILNKPAGYTCTTRKFEGEKNIFELLGPGFGDLNIAGRLDKDSRGLVLLTNDGDYLYELTHPKFGHEKEYLVKIFNFQFSIFKHEAEKAVLKLTNGGDVGEGDGVVKAKEVEYLGGERFRVVLVEGKKRQIRRMF